MRFLLKCPFECRGFPIAMVDFRRCTVAPGASPSALAPSLALTAVAWGVPVSPYDHNLPQIVDADCKSYTFIHIQSQIQHRKRNPAACMTFSCPSISAPNPVSRSNRRLKRCAALPTAATPPHSGSPSLVLRASAPGCDLPMSEKCVYICVCVYMYIYIYMYMYVYVCITIICVCVCDYLNIYIYIHTYIYI